MFELIPAVDMKGGKCVRLQEGVASRSTEYGSDPAAMAAHWESLGAGRLHLVDLDGAFTGQAAHLEIAKKIFQTLKIPVEFGGGLRTLEQIETMFDLGADRVILGTVAIDSPELVEEAVKRHPGAVIVGIDAREGMVALRGWVDVTSVSAVELALRMKNLGVERIIYTDVARDGMLTGVNFEETENLARRTGMKIIGSGGVASDADVRRLWEARNPGGADGADGADGGTGAGVIEGVILGRALYDKKIDFAALRARLLSW
ncbi:MAG: 1-(5-phosphoribosyl)-5-[(5-phosphoribosylamino)methylideneamino]imidazole-4-carboxamide isomerase [Acidobacteriota bacterium]|jgi:phosphoribosylformimino-5-aminoimidazole carboxamide ribotide isomerase|nr:1-(5-phosphoribosyl)-5-[(5-phosphoribosylamino)methylideneamino]imidazole-4-carboxamide isomerase [Acidobacteriota bacterium]